MQESHLEILIPKSKTGQKRQGYVVYIFRIKSECYSVKYVEVYLQKAKLDITNDKESPLICRIFKTRSGHIISKKKKISFREFHFQLEKFLKNTYRRLRRHSRSFVCTLLDQLVHQLQPTTASQTG